MIKKLFLISLILVTPGLNAMQQPDAEKEFEARRFVQNVIQEDDVVALRELIQSGELDPNNEMELGWPYNDFASPLWFAVRRCSTRSVELLLPPITSNELFLKAFFVAISSRSDKPPKGHESTCFLVIVALFLNKAKELGVDIKPILNRDLLSLPHMRHIQFLLSLEADRTIRYPVGNSLISEAQKKLKEVEKKRPHFSFYIEGLGEIIHIFRSYAPDLKTTMALNVLNQVREGKIGCEYFQQHPLPRDIIELIAKLASVDPEAEEKWIAIGMPKYPLDEAELIDVGE